MLLVVAFLAALAALIPGPVAGETVIRSPSGTKIITSHEPPHNILGEACVACHPKEKFDFWLLIYKGKPPALAVESALDNGAGRASGAGAAARCTECHPRKARIAGSPHGELDGGTCGACHPAHAALEAAAPKRRAWEEVFSPDSACLRCHRDGGAVPVPAWTGHPMTKRKVPTTYGATVVLESPVVMAGRLREGEKPLFPLFSDNGVPSLRGRMGCLTCHDPHAGSTLKTGERKAVRYLRDATGAFLAEICAPCHRDDAVERVRRFHALPRKPD